MSDNLHRDLVSRLGFGDNINEPMADNDTIVAWFDEQGRDASEWREHELWRDDCYLKGHPQDDDCHECDPRIRAEMDKQRADHFEHCFKQASCGNCPFSGLALRECKSTICDCFEFPWIEPLPTEPQVGKHASVIAEDVPEMDLPGMWSYSDFAGEFRGGQDHD